MGDRKSLFFLTEEASLASATALWFLRKPNAKYVVVPTIGGGHYGVAFEGPMPWL